MISGPISLGFKKGAFARRQSEIGHKLPRVREAIEVADFRNQGNRRDCGDPAQGLNGGDNLRQRPGGQEFLHLLGQAIATRLGLLHRLHEFFEGNLACGMFETLTGQPKAMLVRPVDASGIDAPVPQKEAQHLLSRTPQRPHRHLPGATKIAHGFVRVVGNPNRREFTRPKQRRLGHRVAPVRLHPVAGSDGNQRGRDHHAFVTERDDLPIEPVAARPGFVTERQPGVFLGQPFDHLGHGVRTAWNLAQEPRFAAPPAFGDRHRYRLLVRIHRHKSRRNLVHGSFPMHEALTG